MNEGKEPIFGQTHQILHQNITLHCFIISYHHPFLNFNFYNTFLVTQPPHPKKKEKRIVTTTIYIYIYICYMLLYITNQPTQRRNLSGWRFSWYLACCFDQYACAVKTRSKSSCGTGSPRLCCGDILAVCTSVFHLS